MKIKHKPLLNVEKIIEHYQKKDGVDVVYVCSTDLNQEDVPVDIFYRDTPHPEFGNRYFGLFIGLFSGDLMITNADRIEELEFSMIEVDDTLHYSRYRHDYNAVGDHFIDGGRAYTRSSCDTVTMKVKDGIFHQKI